MVTEVAALILKLNADVLPSLPFLVNATLAFAVRIFSDEWILLENPIHG